MTSEELNQYTREALATAYDAHARRIYRGRTARHTDISDHDVDEAIAMTVEFVFDAANLDSVDTGLHLINAMYRVFMYNLTIIKRRRYRAVYLHGRDSEHPVTLQSLDTLVSEGLEPSVTPDTMDSVQPKKQPRRVEHPELGSCRIDIAAAYDHLASKQREAVYLTQIKYLSSVEAAAYADSTPSRIRGAKHYGIEGLRKMYDGGLRLSKGEHAGKIYHADPDSETGYVLEHFDPTHNKRSESEIDEQIYFHVA